MHRLVYTVEAKDRIDRLDAHARRQIKEDLEKLAKDPTLGKRLRHELSNFMSYRSGDYRILYKILHQEVIVLVLTVGHRRDIYRKAGRRI